MAKYDGYLGDIKEKLPNAKSVLIALPSDANLDEMASGAALFLALQSHGKEVQIVSDKQPVVSQANLYGVGSIKNTISASSIGSVPQASGDYTLVLEGVETKSLEKLDWAEENGNLNLVFHTLPGQSFQPKNIYPKSGGQTQDTGNSSWDLIFVIGAADLNSLGNIYTQNQSAFSVHTVNIDNSSNNTNFGQTNVVDTNTSSVAEMLTEIIPTLNLPFDRDIATNLLAGIFDMTGGLTNSSVGPDTYVAVGNCLRVGGQKPLSSEQPSVSSQASQVESISPSAQPFMDFSAFTKPPQVAPLAPETNSSGSGSTQFNQTPVAPAPVETSPVSRDESFTMPPVTSVLPNGITPSPTPAPQTYQSSPEERPAGERVVSDSPEPGWLTPKVFKGSSVG